MSPSCPASCPDPTAVLLAGLAVCGGLVAHALILRDFFVRVARHFVP